VPRNPAAWVAVIAAGIVAALLVVGLLLAAVVPPPDRCFSAEQQLTGKRTLSGNIAANLRRVGGSCDPAAPASVPPDPVPDCVTYRDLDKLSPTGNADDCAPE